MTFDVPTLERVSRTGTFRGVSRVRWSIPYRLRSTVRPHWRKGQDRPAAELLRPWRPLATRTDCQKAPLALSAPGPRPAADAHHAGGEKYSIV